MYKRVSGGDRYVTRKAAYFCPFLFGLWSMHASEATGHRTVLCESPEKTGCGYFPSDTVSSMLNTSLHSSLYVCERGNKEHFLKNCPNQSSAYILAVFSNRLNLKQCVNKSGLCKFSNF